MVHAMLRKEFRVKVDDREGIKPGAKYYEWERKGVPLRLEIGARDVEGNSVFSARRTGGKKQGITVDENFVASVQTALDEIQQTLLDNALSLRESKTTTIRSYQELLDGINDGGFFIAPWKDDSANEDKIKVTAEQPSVVTRQNKRLSKAKSASILVNCDALSTICSGLLRLLAKKTN